MKESMNPTSSAWGLVSDMPKHILRLVTIGSDIGMVTYSLRNPGRDNIKLIPLHWIVSRIKVIVNQDWNTSCIFRDALKRINKILVEKAAIETL